VEERRMEEEETNGEGGRRSENKVENMRSK